MHFNVSVIDCRGSCNTIDDPYNQVCALGKVKHECKSISLVPGINETRFLV